MRIIVYENNGKTSKIKTDYPDKITNIIEDFLNNYKGVKVGYKLFVEKMFDKHTIEHISEFNDQLLIEQLEYLNTACLTKKGEVNGRSLNGFINFYRYLLENNLGTFNYFTLEMLENKDIVKLLLNGFRPVIYSPYLTTPTYTKMLVDITKAQRNSKSKSVILFDSSELIHETLRVLYLDFFWNYQEDYTGKPAKDYWLLRFLKSLDSKEESLELPLEITGTDITTYKNTLKDMEDSSRGVALSRVRQFIDYEQGRNNIKISSFARNQVTSTNVKSVGDTRAYNKKQLDEMIIKLNEISGLKNYLVGCCIEIQRRSAMRPETICNLEIDCLISQGTDGFKVKDSTKTNPDDYDPIDIYTGKLIQKLITITQDAREQAPNSKKKYIFLYEADNKQTINKLTRTELCRAINNTAKKLCIPQLGTKGIRNHFDRKLNQFDFEGKANGTIVSAVSKHSMAVHIKHYSVVEDYLTVCGDYYNVEIGEIDLKGKIMSKVDLDNNRVVEDGCGFCCKEHCLNSHSDECQSCKYFVATIDNIPYFESKIEKITNEIINQKSDHEREFLTYKKALLVRYLSELMLLKKSLKEAC